jgi:adenosylcobinamide-phosphate synthase
MFDLTLIVVALAVLVALAVDRWLGEPPVRLHPVVWMGNYLGHAGAWVQRHARQDPGPSDYKAFWLAALMWCAGAAMVLGVAWGLQGGVYWAVAAGLAGSVEHSGQRLHGIGGSVLIALLLGILLKPLLAWAMLKSEVRAVEVALDAGQGGSLDAGRERLRWLVSRDVAQLSESQVRESAIETLAENLNDSVVAPIFWFVLLGLPGAALYRFANTADAMWGYRGVYQGQNWEWAGKWAARADDVLSWVPARLTALLLWVVSGKVGAAAQADRVHLGRPSLRGLIRLRQEASRTPSPNSGWPMAAMALGLGVRLHKPGVYVLNGGGREALSADTILALRLASKGLLALVGIAIAAIFLIAFAGVTGAQP